MIIGMVAALAASGYLIVFSSSLTWWSIEVVRRIMTNRATLEFIWFIGLFAVFFAIIAGFYAIRQNAKVVRRTLFGGERK
jgi:hypothetical protein